MVYRTVRRSIVIAQTRNGPDTDNDSLSDGFEANMLGTNPDSQLTPVWLAIISLPAIGLVITVVVAVRRWRRGQRSGVTHGDQSVETIQLDENQPNAR